jgi:hypothetical protein
MHKVGYCLCNIVECAYCPDETPEERKKHPAHKPHFAPRQTEKVHIAVDKPEAEPHIAVTAETAGGKGTTR